MINKNNEGKSKLYKKKEKTFVFIILFFALIAGYLLVRANPQFENPIKIFSSSSFEEEAFYKVTEYDIDVNIKELTTFNEGWLVHMEKGQNEKVLILDNNLSKLSSFEVEWGSILHINSNNEKWLVYNPDKQIVIYDEEVKEVAEINMNDKEKISSSELGILVGEKRIEAENGISYIEQLKWFDYKGELLKELELRNLIVLEGIKDDYIDEKYLVMNFSENPNIKLIKAIGSDPDDNIQIEDEMIDLRLEENFNTYMKSQENLLAVGNERKVIFKKDEIEQIYKTEDSKITSLFLLDENRCVLVKKSENEYSMVKLELTRDDLRIIKERPLRGYPLDITKKQSNPNKVIIATTSHTYEFIKSDSNILRSPWRKIEKGIFDMKGEYFLTFEPETKRLIMYKNKNNE